MTRVELSQRLGVGLTTVDRLIGFGLRSVGRRGRAKLYRLSDARRWAEQRAPAQLAAADVLITDYRSHAEDLHDRRQHVVSEWIADRAWRPLWQAAVAAVSRLSASWPQQLADRLGPVAPEEHALLLAADDPRPDPRPPRRYLGPAEVQALLAGPERAQPWRPAARQAIAGLAATGRGIEISVEGGWMAWNPATGIPVAPLIPSPWMRPLLEELVEVIKISTAFAGLAATLQPPAIEPLPATPATVDDARAQWRLARAAYRRVKTAIRRGHTRRADVAGAITEGIARFRARWWQARAELAGVAGDPAAVRALAEHLRQETLAQLVALDAAPEDTTTEIDPEPIPRPSRRRKPTTKRRERR